LKSPHPHGRERTVLISPTRLKSATRSEMEGLLEWTLALSVDVYIHAVKVLYLSTRFTSRVEKMGNQGLDNRESGKTSKTTSPLEWTLALSVDV